MNQLGLQQIDTILSIIVDLISSMNKETVLDFKLKVTHLKNPISWQVRTAIQSHPLNATPVKEKYRRREWRRGGYGRKDKVIDHVTVHLKLTLFKTEMMRL